MWLLKGNERATSDVMTRQWSKYAHLKNNVKRNFVFKNEKGGMPLHVMQKISFLFKGQWNPSYMKAWTLFHLKNLMQVPNQCICRMQ